MRVRQRFAELQAMDEKDQTVPWHVINAAQSIEQVQLEINQIVHDTMKRVAEGAPLRKMFQEGEYVLASGNSQIDHLKAKEESVDSTR
jgi:hypothetical protein